MLGTSKTSQVIRIQHYFHHAFIESYLLTALLDPTVPFLLQNSIAWSRLFQKSHRISTAAIPHVRVTRASSSHLKVYSALRKFSSPLAFFLFCYNLKIKCIFGGVVSFDLHNMPTTLKRQIFFLLWNKQEIRQKNYSPPKSQYFVETPFLQQLQLHVSWDMSL